MIYRVGDGTDPLGSAAAPVFLSEFTPAGTFVQDILMPTFAAGATKRLTARGDAVSEGLMTLSTDGNFLTLTGYDADVGLNGR